MNRNDRFCVMLDCSRNAVMKPQKIKEFVLILKEFGYNSVMLYLEDTFEVGGEPMFGYLRGRYTKEELKDLDGFCNSVGMELIPCVQTLAHLNAIFRWKEYAKINDINDVLLVEDERTYKLIDGIFETVEECFTCKTVNIGLDEAHALGRGKYLDKFGYQDRFELFSSHLQKVNDLAKKRGLTPILWSDTFFEKGADGVPYANLNVPECAVKALPDNVELVCWDYYHTNKDFYDTVLDAHKQFNNPLWYACSAYSSRGFAPCNAYSLKAIRPAMQSCRERGVNNIIVTMWGGNGAECSFFALLPSLLFAVETFNGNDDINSIAQKFKDITGEDFFNMMSLDLPNDVGAKGLNYGPSKYMLYNDPFAGIYDCTINPSDSKTYENIAKTLYQNGKDSKYKYVFDCLALLSEILAKKYTLGLDTRKAYNERDIKGLKGLVKRYGEIISLVEKFSLVFKKQWFTDNKPHGFDVQDLRLGGLIQRLISCRTRLNELIKGKTNAIEELDEPILDLETGTSEFSKQTVVLNDWKTNVTVNIL
ncbi:MAG: beta-N-acetylhexosaminidase [Clostridia bacterium]|nr:beta-N-acetylhexosaminidase [Clostridia bacterium]